MANVNGPMWFWHYRHRHLNVMDVQISMNWRLFLRITWWLVFLRLLFPSEICEVYVVGKQHSKHIKGNAWKAKMSLDLIHFNMCSPVNPISNGKKKYLAFKKFKVQVQNKVEKTIQTLQTHCANFRDEHGFRRQLTEASHLSKMVYWRKDWTIVNMARRMQANGEIPKSFRP